MTHQIPDIGTYSVYLEETTSTNDELKALYLSGTLPEGAMVYTDFQSKGRGQQQAVWESAPRMNILASFLLTPVFLAADEQVWLNVCVSLAVRKTISELCHEEAQIKWPNDIYIRNKKICGILIENVLQGTKIKYSVIGTGININQGEFAQPIAISVKQVTGNEKSLKEARELLCSNLTFYYRLLKTRQWSTLWATYHDFLYAKGLEAVFELNQELVNGQIMGIDKKGRLHILINDEVRSFANKEIKLVNITQKEAGK